MATAAARRSTHPEAAAVCAQLDLVDKHLSQAELLKADEGLKSVFQLCSGSGDPRLQAAGALRQAQYHVERNEIKKTRRAATEAEKLFKSFDDEEGLAEVSMVRAWSEVKLEDPEEIVKAATQAVELFKKVGRVDRQAEAMGLIVDSLASTHQGLITRISTALRFANRALVLHEEAASILGQAHMMQRIASLHLDAKELERAEWAGQEAQVLWRKAKRDTEALKMHFFLCKVCEAIILAEESGQLASVHTQHPRCALQRAVALSNEAFFLAKDAQEPSLRGMALYWRAKTRIWQADDTSMQDAMLMLEAALEVYQESGDRAGEASAMTLQAQALATGGRLQAASAKAEEAVKFAKLYDQEQAAEEAAEVLEGIKAMQADLKASGRNVQQVEETAGESGQETGAIAIGDQKASKKRDIDPEFLRSKLSDIVKTVCVADDDILQDEALMDIGVDSLSSVTLVNEATQAFGIPLRPSVVFDHPTIRELVAHILEEAN
mmetsp:Transcript_64507/g.154049  ORF Transcript_64507/g.154049 Transcript_64507/m.154049 type:complete len:494 (+) Transcript_64507:90-1571(+)